MSISQPPALLFVTYAFPPRGGVAVQRMLSFVQGAVAHDFRPIVLTVTPPRGTVQHDSELLRAIPPEALVIRTTSLEPYRLYRALGGRRAQDDPRHRATHLATGEVGERSAADRAYAAFSDRYLVPDAKIGWYPLALEAARLLLRTENIQAVIATTPPASTAVIGATIAKEAGLPLILDYRDPWTTGFYAQDRPTKVAQRERTLEERVLAQAAAVVTVSAEFGARVAQLANENAVKLDLMRVIPNGFMGQTYTQLLAERFDKPTLLHTGSLYHHRSPTPFFEAAARLKAADPELWDAFDVLLLGNVDPAYLAQAKGLGLTNVSHRGFVSHREALAAQLGADILLLFSEGMLTAKVYEYLRAQHPILAIGDSVELATLLSDWGAGHGFGRGDIDRIVAQLEKLLRERLAAGEARPLPLTCDLATIERTVLAEQFLQIVKATIEGRALPGSVPDNSYTAPLNA